MADKILVVDDEKEIVDLVSLYLKNEGYEVAAFYSGVEALAHVKHERFDLAILDIMMPEVDGLLLCQAIRRAISIRSSCSQRKAKRWTR